MEENGWILDNVSRSMPRFIITNGTWSKNIVDTTKFMLWVEQHRLEVFVSGTDQHVSFQDRTMLEDLAARYPKIVHLKKADTQILPMGKLFGAPVKCTAKCMRQDVPTRLAVQPDGSIIYQTCDGVYPVIGSLNDSFSAVMTRVEHYIKHGFGDVCPYYEGACQRKS